MADLGPGAVVGWLRAHDTVDGLAGCGFLVGPDIVLTCAHVIGAHLGLPYPVPKDRPTEVITIRFEALQDEVTGRVLPGGWFSNARSRPGELADLAVVCLDEPVTAISPLPAIAQRMPTQSQPVLIHGAEADYKSYGQQVQGEMGGSNISRGWRQIDPKNSRGFMVEAGFSGSAVLDDLGNVVWGMVVAVAEQGTGIAYAIPAEHLWAALRSAGAETTVRFSGRLPLAIKRRPSIFICHADEDSATALELFKRLESFGYDPWLDKEKLLPGQYWEHEIKKAVRGAKFFVLLLSKTSVSKRGYIQKEFKMAMESLSETPEGTIYLIPLKLDDCLIPQQFSTFHWIELKGQESFNKIRQSIESQMDMMA